MSALRLLSLLLVLTLLAACGEDDGDDAVVVDPDGQDPAQEGAAEDDEPEGDAGDDGDDGGDDDGEASEGTSEEEPDAEDADGVASVRVWVVRDHDGRLWLESERRDLAEPTVAVAGAAMNQLLSQPTRHPDLSAPAGTDVTVEDVAIDDGVLVVDVDDAIYDAATGAEGEQMLRQALAHTGAQFDSVDAVRLRVDGEAVDELWGHLDWSEPATPSDEHLAFIDVTDPAWLDAHPAGEPLTVRGTSLTFESTVTATLVDPEGIVAEETFTTADQPDVDERGPFELTFDTVPEQAGRWTIVVEQPDPSGGEGGEPYVVETVVEVE